MRKVVSGMRVVAALVWSLGVPLGVEAQSRYRLGPDTLRYQEHLEFEMSLSAGELSRRSQVVLDATVATVLQPDALAWYEAISARLSVPGERDSTVSMDEVLGRQFAFAFTDQGKVTIKSAPELPPEARPFTTATFQFSDWFISLPRAALRPGLTWSDTTRSRGTGQPWQRFRGEAMRRYRVERDTVVGSERAFIVAVRTTSTIEIEIYDPRIRMGGDITTIELGFVIITENATRMLSRTRSGRAEGAMKASARQRSVEFPLKMEYRGGTVLIPPRT